MEKYSLQSDTPVFYIVFCDFSAGRSGQISEKYDGAQEDWKDCRKDYQSIILL